MPYLLSRKDKNQQSNSLNYRYHFSTLPKSLPKFEGCAYLSVYHFEGACDGRGCVFDKEGNASQRPHPQITKHAYRQGNVAYSSQIYSFRYHGGTLLFACNLLSSKYCGKLFTM